MKTALFLRPDIARLWGDGDPFAAARRQTGTIFRDKEGRRTLRFEHQQRGYFLKLHQGVGWKEIAKNLLQGRLPVLGADNEFQAIRALEKLHIDTLSVAGFGRRGISPATQLSFLVTDELLDTQSLEDFCRPWLQQPPPLALKLQLIARLAEIARTMHRGGINHRDFYLCHFLLDVATPVTAANFSSHRLYLMDLHRAQIRAAVPQRWLIKDLGALYYSALDIGLSKRDILRFVRSYRQQSLRLALAGEKPFWSAVVRRAAQIYRRDHGRIPASPAWLG